ncbi:MAG: 3D domain-containing protein [Bacillota bacterium]
MLPLAKNIRRYVSFKIAAIMFLAIVVSVSVGIGVFTGLRKEVVIDYDGSRTTVNTMKSTVKEVLQQNGIKISEYDYISLPLDKKLHKTNTIYIKSAVPITVLADGQEMKIMTAKDTVREALEADPVNLSAIDRIEGAKPDDKVVKDMRVKVVRVKQKLVSQNEIIPCQVIRRENDKMDEGQQKVVEQGKDGVEEKLFRVVYEDGKEVRRQLLNVKIVSDPVKRLVEYGTVLNFTTSRGEKFRYKKVLNMRATAYTASFKDTGKSPGHPEFGITYTGIRARRGVIAVDPRVIPLGTRVYVEGVGDVPDYGYAIAADIGSAIKGDLIDLYMDGQETVDRWGVKKVRVYILQD